MIYNNIITIDNRNNNNDIKIIILQRYEKTTKARRGSPLWCRRSHWFRARGTAQTYLHRANRLRAFSRDRRLRTRKRRPIGIGMPFRHRRTVESVGAWHGDRGQPQTHIIIIIEPLKIVPIAPKSLITATRVPSVLLVSGSPLPSHRLVNFDNNIHHINHY